MREILIPAGSPEAIERAVNLGADAVYFGLKKYSARASAVNLSLDELPEKINFCHLYGVRAYIAINTVLTNEELIEAQSYISDISKAGADGVIVCDIGLLPLIAKAAPSLPIHISTQAGAHNLSSASYFEKLGADRIVLSRESTSEDIKEIAENTRLELEYFVHGALCVSFSGGCLMSAVRGGGSGNKGGCLQPCRQRYTLSVNRYSKSGFMLSAKDQCLINRLDALEKLGVSSFKIEGRLKRKEYSAETALSYKSALSGINNSDLIKRLKTAYCRGEFCEGYIFTPAGRIINPDIEGHTGLYAGKVQKVYEKGGYEYAAVSSAFPLSAGDGLKIMRGTEVTGGAELTCVNTLGKQTYEIPVSRGTAPQDDIYLTTDEKRNRELNNITRKLNVDLILTAYIGKRISLELISGGEKICVASDYIPEEAYTAPTSKAEFAAALNKTGNTPFTVSSIDYKTAGNVFVPASILNELRRNGYKKLEAALIENYKPAIRKNTNMPMSTVFMLTRAKRITVEISNLCQVSKVIADRCANIVFNPQEFNVKAFTGIINVLKSLGKINPLKIYAALPKLLRRQDTQAAIEIVNMLKIEGGGIYASNYGHVEIARQNGMPYIAGTGLNLTNSGALSLLSDAEEAVLSAELSKAEAVPMLESGASLYAFGYLPVMTLAHCPIETASGKGCSDCVYDGEFTYSDAKYVYPAYRTRLKSCQFTVYNAVPHDLSGETAENNYNLYLNMLKYSNAEAERIITAFADGKAYSSGIRTKGSYIKAK